MNDLDTFLARAAEARADAREAKLDNVRERCLRAAVAWEQMAERVQRTEKMRATLAAEKERAANGEQAPIPSWPANIENKKPRTNEQETFSGRRERQRLSS